MTDRELVACLVKRDTAAFEEIINRYTAYVMTVIIRIAVPPITEQDAEELVSDVFVTLWKTASTVREPEALRAYLGQIARNAARRRRKMYRKVMPLEDDILISEQQQPFERAVIDEQRKIIVDALASIEPVRRRCLVRRFYYEQPLSVIAREMSLPLSTVKSHIYRGKQQLLDALKERGYEYEN